MGFCAHSYQSEFRIQRENREKVRSLIISEFPLMASLPRSEHWDDIDLLCEFGLTAEENETGDISNVYFEYQRYVIEDMNALFHVIAPCVQPGSSLCFVGEDDSLWAIYFDGEKFTEYRGEIVFPGMPTA